MGDEIEGPYKIVSVPQVYPAPVLYSIVVQRKRETFLQMYIPDAGNGEVARKICNMLNKEYKELMEVETNDSTDGFDVEGVRYPD